MTSPRERRFSAQQQKLGQAGLRLIEIWVPDTGAPGFTEECSRQSRLLAETGAESEAEDMAFIEQITADEWE